MTAFQTGSLLPGKWYVSKPQAGSSDGETFNYEEAAKTVLSPPFDNKRAAQDWARENSERFPHSFVWQFTENSSPVTTMDLGPGTTQKNPLPA